MSDGSRILTRELLMEHVSYDHETGIFTLIKKTHARDNTRKIGGEIGYLDGRGYIHVSLFGSKYKAHRLAWLYVTGEWPESIVDHIDGDKTNNKWSNLRLATCSQNLANIRVVRSLSGAKGVYPVRNKVKSITGWCAQHNKKHLGVYQTIDEAADAYDRYLFELHGEFAATNKEIL